MAKAMFDKNGLVKADGTLTVYDYNVLTGEFTGAVQEFLAQGVGLPACACLTAPPDAQAGTVAVYQDGN